ncbi:uncharacterized protein GGS25DRAFT_534258 [Hypoxylon fragiforme]|uniref:uncharacterized protein n=1 Tax=Hypoxylon fragiforme TaxID=63214 RepID=UPI0020C636C3|nr:uncharacterized protein GGS25DRAFT_534258 [Hypoxylon fragiforme]KAI2605342.1 hypothetical protein GGS25DRAFT_534258 [Hypoxylon fragiforme]
MSDHVTGKILCAPKHGTEDDACRFVHLDSYQGPTDQDLPNIRGLTNLQLRHNELLSGDVIERALAGYHRGLPEKVQQRVHLGSTSIAGLFTTHESDNYRSALAASYKSFFAAFSNNEISLWPINWEDRHWILLVILKRDVNPGGQIESPASRIQRRNRKWTSIVQVGLCDSYSLQPDASQSSGIIFARLERIFEVYGFVFAQNYRRKIWVPYQTDSWSCGLRVYSAAKQMMDRLVNVVARTPDAGANFWRPTLGWFNPDSVRSEMINLNISEAILELNYQARHSIELINTVKDDNGIQVDAGVLMRPPRDTKYEVDFPPAREENPQDEQDAQTTDELVDVSCRNPQKLQAARENPVGDTSGVRRRDQTGNKRRRPHDAQAALKDNGEKIPQDTDEKPNKRKKIDGEETSANKPEVQPIPVSRDPPSSSTPGNTVAQRMEQRMERLRRLMSEVQSSDSSATSRVTGTSSSAAETTTNKRTPGWRKDHFRNKILAASGPPASVPDPPSSPTPRKPLLVPGDPTFQRPPAKCAKCLFYACACACKLSTETKPAKQGRNYKRSQTSETKPAKQGRNYKRSQTSETKPAKQGRSYKQS